MRRAAQFSFALSLLGVAIVLASLWGSVPLPWSDFWLLVSDPQALPEASRLIISQLRLPRILLAALVGASLALAGCGLQGLLRNPLADPYIVGTSSGASLGATLAIVWNLPNLTPYLSAVPAMAFIGALGAMFLVYRLAKVNNFLPVETFLLAGVIVGSFAGALVSLLLTMAGQDLQRVMLWLMGTLEQPEGPATFWLLLPYLVGGGATLLCCAQPLNLLGLGEENAQALGVNVERLKLWVVAASSLMTAAAVSVAGMIGFLGLVVPHLTRRLVGPDHRWLLPLCALNGATFLIVADMIARVIIAPRELPVGVLTALVGAPFFFFILKCQRSN